MSAQNLTAYEIAHYNDDLGPGLIAGSSFLIAVMIIATTLRVVGQTRAWGKLGLDDYLILLGLPLNIALCVFNITMVCFGLGKHQWRVDAEDPHTPHNLIWIFHFGYLLSVFQPPAITTIKASILVYYHRVFTGMQKSFTYALWFNGAFVAAWYIASQCVTIWHCSPPSFFWNRSYAATHTKPPQPVHGTCLDSQAVWVPILSISIVSDLMILILPYIGLRGLQMPMKRKAGFLLLFALGVFVCVAAGIRLYFTMQIINTGDISWSNAEAEIWYSIESCVGLVCACIPTFASLFTHFKRSRAAKGSSHGYSSSQNNWGADAMDRATKARSRHNNMYNELDDDHVELVGFKNEQRAQNSTKASATPDSSRIAVRNVDRDTVGVRTDISVYT